MHHRLARAFAPVIICAAALAFAGAPSAGAAATAHSASFVGTYTFHTTFGSDTSKAPVTIKADGTALDKEGNVAHWSNTGKSFTIDYSDKHVTEHWAGTQSKKGIGSKQHPGTVTISGEGDGTWYAVKTG